MTVGDLNTTRCALAPAMAAALTLAGCTATHIGEDWQCPLAQGAHCASVAAADPMARRPATDGDRTAEHGETRAVLPASVSLLPATPDIPTEAVRDGGGSGCSTPNDSVPTNDAPPPAAGVPAAGEQADGGAPSCAAGEPLPDASLRRPETIARVWIAPHVDADGVYREASWVRIVVAPAAWRTR